MLLGKTYSPSKYLLSFLFFFVITSLGLFGIPQRTKATTDSDLLQTVAALSQYNIPPALMAAIMNNESHFGIYNISNTGCVGLGQICSGSAPADHFDYICSQKSSLGPTYCDATHNINNNRYATSTCSTPSATCVLDERFDVEKAVRGSARVIASKRDSMSRCDITTESGIKAITFAYNSGQEIVNNAIDDAGGSCNNYTAIWEAADAAWQPLLCTGASAGVGCGPTDNDGNHLGRCASHPDYTELICQKGSDDIYGTLYGRNFSRGKLDRKSNSTNPNENYITRIYRDFLHYGGTTPNSTFDAINFNRTISGGNGYTSSGNISQFITTDNLKQPDIGIQIPGLTFTPLENLLALDPDTGTQYIVMPFLGEYIAAIFRLSIGVASIVAIIVVIVSGIQWMSPGNIISNEDKSTINQAKKRIVGSILGLILLVSSYTILFVINPELTSLTALRIEVVQPIVPASDGVYEDVSTHSFSGTMGNPPTDLDELDQCLYDNFLIGKNIGDRPDISQVNFFNIRDVRVNQQTTEAWEQIFMKLQTNPSPTIQGYIQYMKDIANGDITNLKGDSGNSDAGIVSANIGRIGYRKDDVTLLNHLRGGMHGIGLAVDFMTRENWDIHTDLYSGSAGDSINRWCNNYYEGFQNALTTYLQGDPYNINATIERNLEACFNGFEIDPNTGNRKPWTTMPDDFIQLFEQNGFYWAGWAWGNPYRSDGMHFEYYGPCLSLRQSLDQRQLQRKLDDCREDLADNPSHDFCGEITHP